MLIFTAFRYETDSFSAPIINIYSPGFKSADGVKVNDTCFELPASSEYDNFEVIKDTLKEKTRFTKI